MFGQKIVLLSVLLVLSSCGGEQKVSKATVQFVSIQGLESVGEQFPGGAVLYAHNEDLQRSVSFVPTQVDDVLSIDQGPWEFRVVGWTGNTAFSGQVYCGLLEAELTQPEESITIEVSQEQCLEPTFQSSEEFMSEEQFKPIRLISCQGLPEVMNASAHCHNNPGVARSIRFELPQFEISSTLDKERVNPNELSLKSGISSQCFVLDNPPESIVETQMRFPSSDLSYLGPMMMKVSIYKDLQCQDKVHDYHFLSGVKWPSLGYRSGFETVVLADEEVVSLFLISEEGLAPDIPLHITPSLALTYYSNVSNSTSSSFQILARVGGSMTAETLTSPSLKFKMKDRFENPEAPKRQVLSENFKLILNP